MAYPVQLRILQPFMTLSAPPAFYNIQLNSYQAQLSSATERIRRIAGFRLVTMLVAIGFIVGGINTGTAFYWWGSLFFTAFFLVWVRIHSALHHKEKLLKIHVYILEKELAALEGDQSSFGSGQPYVDSTHPYSYDLDIFGKGSVYQLLNRTVTLSGADQLAAHLKSPVNHPDTIKTRQDIITELGNNPSFLQDFRVAGMSVEEEPEDYERVQQWLKAPDDFISSPIARIAFYVMPLLTTGLGIYSIITGVFNSFLVLAVAINWIVLIIFQKPIKMANIHIGKTARLVEKYQQLQQQVAIRQFAHPWLQELCARSTGALEQIIRFRKLANTFDSRNNSMVGPLMNSFFLFDIYCLLRLEWWRRAHKELLLQTIESMIVTDVYVSCATYAFNHPENVYPAIDPMQTTILATDLRHPLLAKHAVGNSFSLGTQEQFYLLTGANMTGKSTFIRTVGISVILGYLGVPVPASSFSLPLLRIYTSIRVTDSVQDDVSYFRAELNRIKDIMNAVQQTDTAWLILLDEPLRGTNSGDKQQGTRSIIETLLRSRTIGIVATHDIGLTVLSTDHPGKVSNYHFESAITSDGLTFDFKLHPGGSTSNNATILMKQMGIIQ